MRDDFAVFILSHGRSDKIKTYNTLKKQGYTGKIYIIIDNEDVTADRYIEKFGEDKVVIFDKAKYSKITDTADISGNNQAVVFARNACFDIAEQLGLRYFLQLDDDYGNFRYRYNDNGKLRTKKIQNLDLLFSYTLDFLNDSGALTVALGQGGDYIGGVCSKLWKCRLHRKAMNSFFCDVKKPFKFSGRLNEDVNMYTLYGNQGKIIFTIADAQIEQSDTQSLKGGLTDIYLQYGTYRKSFYSVIYAPQCVKVAEMGVKHKRLHHRINWNNCIPLIISEKYKKVE
jgi:hypothetical protein